MTRGFEPGRLFGLDVARGLALFGMFAAHVLPRDGERVVDGRSAILFAVVAGASLGLLTGGAEPAPPAPGRASARIAVAIRGLALIVIGVLLSFAQPPIAVILDSYGAGFLLLIPLLFAPPALLVGLAAGVAIAGPWLIGWATAAVGYDDVPAAAQPFALWLTHGAYPLALWLAYLLAGLAAARTGLHRTPVRVALLTSGAVAALLGYGAAAVIPGATAAAHSDSTFEAFGSGGVALAVVGAALLLTDAPGMPAAVLRRVLWPVAAAGSTVLSLYVAHALVLAGFRAAEGAEASLPHYPDWLLAAFIGGALVAGSLWRAFVGRGPLEAALHLVTAQGARPRVTP